MPLYVDHTQLVKITLLARDKELALIVSNTVRPDAKPGTGLGLQNCAQMLRLHGGRFEHSLSEGGYSGGIFPDGVSTACNFKMPLLYKAFYFVSKRKTIYPIPLQNRRKSSIIKLKKAAEMRFFQNP